jgi:hypothetical protein
MIRHCVTFRFHEGTSPDAVEALRAAPSALPAAIPEIDHYWCGPDLGLRDTNVDFAVVADFADETGFLAYARHPEHQAIIRDLVEPITAERHAVQFSC